MAKPSLYVIIDIKKRKIKNPVSLAKKAVDGGADFIQLRAKDIQISEILRIGKGIRDIARKKGVPFIINDRIGLAFALDADGIHLGQDDMPFGIARFLLGRKSIIGLSCHNLKQAKEAAKFKPDYISFGPVFVSANKPKIAPIGLGILKSVANCVDMPVFAIGGINAANIKEVLSSGIKNVACISAIEYAQNPAMAAKELKDILCNKR